MTDATINAQFRGMVIAVRRLGVKAKFKVKAPSLPPSPEKD